MNLDDVRTAINQLEELGLDTPPDQLRAAGDHALEVVSRECSLLQMEADDYPDNPIRGDVWMDGAVLGPMAERLASLLCKRGLHEQEEKAHTLRCMAVLAMQSHYHHLVGPAMLARGDCNERLGRHDLAEQIYEAVIADFSWIVDSWENEPDRLPDDDRCSLQCLQQALERRLARQALDTDGEFASLLQRCKEILTRNVGDAK